MILPIARHSPNIANRNTRQSGRPDTVFEIDIACLPLVVYYVCEFGHLIAVGVVVEAVGL